MGEALQGLVARRRVFVMIACFHQEDHAGKPPTRSFNRLGLSERC